MISDPSIFIVYSLLFFSALAFSVLINSVFLRFSRTLGIREKTPELIRWSANARPAFGGLAFYIVFLLSFAAYGIIIPEASIEVNRSQVGLLLATALAFLMGLTDDAYNTKPVLKVVAQISCALVMVLTGTCIEFFSSPTVNIILTVVWVVGMMNSINMLDNMDGITTIVSICILLTAIVVHILAGIQGSLQLVLLTGTIAALVGFLFFNWHPSKMFMGDSGSQFLGVYLAFIGIEYFWNTASGPSAASQALIVVLIAFLLPIVDTTSVTINRLMKKSSPFVGGKDHTTHHLGYLGLGDAQVALTFIGICLVNLFLTYVLFKFLNPWQGVYAWPFLIYALVVGGTLFAVTKKTKPPIKVGSDPDNEEIKAIDS